MTPPPTIPTWYLRLDGLEIPVRATSGGELALDRGGEMTRVNDNAVYSNAIAAEARRSWRFTTPHVLYPEWAPILALLEDLVPHLADGWAIDQTGLQVPVLALLEETPNEYENATEIRYSGTFTLLEVDAADGPVPPGGP